MPEYETWGTVCVVIDAEAAIERDIKFWVTRANAVITRAPIEKDLVVYIFDNKMYDPMDDPLFTRQTWRLKNKNESDQMPGGTQAPEQASSSSGPATHGWEDWSEGQWHKRQEESAASSSAAPAAEIDPDIDPLEEANREEFEEIYRIYLMETQASMS